MKWADPLLYIRSKAESSLRVAEYVSKCCKTSHNIKLKLPDADEVEHWFQDVCSTRGLVQDKLARERFIAVANIATTSMPNKVHQTDFKEADSTWGKCHVITTFNANKLPWTKLG
eukprot:2054746-Amphidinium_carterae.1